MSLQPNPLNQFRLYNYRLSLSAVTKEEYNSGNYLDSERLVIARSGGTPAGSGNIQTYTEEQLGINVEYFIDDLNIEGLVIPNGGTGTSEATQMSFTISEPYSIGLFFQTLNVAALEAGFRGGAMESPFLLTVDFIGHTDTDTTKTLPKHSFAIKIVDLKFNATASGSNYQVKAIPANHQVFTDTFQEVKTDVKIKGQSVDEVLSLNENSLQALLNSQELNRVSKNEKTVADKYYIVFPKDPTQAQSSIAAQSAVIQGASTNPSNFGALSPEDIVPFNKNKVTVSTVGLSTDKEVNEFDKSTGGGGKILDGKTITSTSTNNAVYDDAILRHANKQIPNSTPMGNIPVQSGPITRATLINPNSNQFGNSLITDNFQTKGTSPFGVDNLVWENNVYKRGSMSIDPRNREFTFAPGTKIEKMIEEVILSSEWGEGLIDIKPGLDKKIEWFKIDGHLKIISDDNGAGRPAYEFIFAVIPYQMDYGIFDSNSEQNYDELIQNCVKSYSYAYTGKNIDVLDFEFKIDNSFFRPMIDTQATEDKHKAGVASEEQTAISQNNISQAGELSGTDAIDAAAGRFSSVVGGLSGTDAIDAAAGRFSQRSEPVLDTGAKIKGGSSKKTDKKIVAEQFQSLVMNSDIENITLDLTIWGDPYYLLDNDAGNQRFASNKFTTSNGTINTKSTEVDVLVRFNSAIDYNLRNTLQIDPNNAFNGVYKVITISTALSKGQFVQTLKLLRRPGQSDSSVEFSNSIIENFTSSLDPKFIPTMLENRRVFNNPISTSFFGNAASNLFADLGLGKINVQELEKISAAPVIEMLNKSQELIDVGLQIQNNLRNSLSSIEGLSGKLGIDIPNLGTMVQNIPDASQALKQVSSDLAGAVSATNASNLIKNAKPWVNPDLAKPWVNPDLGVQQLKEATSALQSQFPKGINSALQQATTDLQSQFPQGIGSALEKARLSIDGAVIGGLSEIPQALEGLSQTYGDLQRNLLKKHSQIFDDISLAPKLLESQPIEELINLGKATAEDFATKNLSGELNQLTNNIIKVFN
tara:strand:+ start:285 stop:3404 length:3120 start_codon:yes stop_codon:yes gene_type:complete